MDKDVFKHYTLGIQKIDKEHLELIQLMEHILDCETDHDCSETINELRTKFYRHCSSEEEYMSSISYPFLEAHKDSHKRIAVELEECLRHVGNGYVDRYTSDRLVRIFITHIDHQDMQILDFLNRTRM